MEAPYVPPSMPTDEGSIFEGISTGINFDKYDSIPVEVSDPKFQVPFTSFEEMGLCDLLLRNLRRAQYTKPTPVQKYAIKIALGGRDLMACAQTGSGKTASPNSLLLVALRPWSALCGGLTFACTRVFVFCSVLCRLLLWHSASLREPSSYSVARFANTSGSF